MTTDYNKFAKTFSKSRKNMKWEELEYFFSMLGQGSVLDIGCGNGRLLEQYQSYFRKPVGEYFGLDMSSGLINEAKIAFPEKKFGVGNMMNLSEIIGNKQYDNIFLIASFHHLESLADREKMMKNLYNVCKPGGKIFMTHWALESSLNKEKYAGSKIENSENIYKSTDYSIKIGGFHRFYHCFSLSELEYLSQTSGFTMVENRLFKSEKNIITILQK